METITNHKKIILCMLMIALLATLGLAAVHNHYSDLGRQFDPNCPICHILIGFILCLVTGFVGVILSKSRPMLVPVSIPHQAHTDLIKTSPRSPPTI